MSIAQSAGGAPRAIPLDLSWRNAIFSLRTAAAAILALATAFWLELDTPKWATITVYILAQPTVGGAIAKGAWRALGTLAGGTWGLVLVGLFSQAAELLVAATALSVAVSFYLGARRRNFAAYGALLAAYTTVLVAYEGASHPSHAWAIAVDRTTAILIGIACSAAASALIFPRYANDALQQALSQTFEGLSSYVATALRLSTPSTVFADLRSRMVGQVITFDALRSYTAFETPELPADQWLLQRVVRKFLMVLSITRAVFFRLDAFDKGGGQRVLDHIAPTLASIAGRIEKISADAGPGNLAGLRRELIAAHAELKRSAAGLGDMAGSTPFDPLANGVLVLNRVGEVLHGLAAVVVTSAATFGGRESSVRALSAGGFDPLERREAFLLSLRAGFAIALLSAFWLASGWNEGFTAVSGGAIMLFFGVNQDDPLAGARDYLIGSALGVTLGYLTMVSVLPHLEGFVALALVLVVVLFPAGLMAGTPRPAWMGVAFGAFTVAGIGAGNVFAPDEVAYINKGVALILGMLVCLMVIAVFPVTSRARRRQSWERAVGAVLPGVARGRVPSRRGADRIVEDLAALLPRLALERQGDEDFFRGSLSAASCAIELGRLVSLRADAALPRGVADSIGNFLERFAGALEGVTARDDDPRPRVAEAARLVAHLHAELAAQDLEPGATAIAILRAGASLRFIADRFSIDRAYFERSFVEEWRR
jgi:uncharacterized membrane protein YccC